MAEVVAVLDQNGKDLRAGRAKEPTKYPWIDVLRGVAILVLKLWVERVPLCKQED